MKSKTKYQDWRNYEGVTGHYLQILFNGFRGLNAFISGERNIEITGDNIPESQPRTGPVNYDLVLQFYQNIDDCLRGLQFCVKDKEITRGDFKRLLLRRNILVKLCEDKRKCEFGVEIMKIILLTYKNMKMRNSGKFNNRSLILNKLIINDRKLI